MNEMKKNSRTNATYKMKEIQGSKNYRNNLFFGKINKIKIKKV